MPNGVFLLLEVTSIKMKPKTRKLMEWLARNDMLLESQIVGSGLSKALDDALVQGWAEITAHPTVKDGKIPATAAFITTKGRSALEPTGTSKQDNARGIHP